MGNIIFKIRKILEDLEHSKKRGVTFWLEGNGLLVIQIFDQFQNAVIVAAFCN